MTVTGLDPAARAVRLPANQRWALDLPRDPALPDRLRFVEADAPLAVRRDQAVLRVLSAIRRETGAGQRKPLRLEAATWLGRPFSRSSGR